MKIGGYRTSGNYSERTGGVGMAGGLGIGGVLIALVAMFFGVDPSVVLNTAEQVAPQKPQQESSVPRDDTGQFMSRVLASTEDTWEKIFRASGANYPAPKMVRFEGGTRTAC